MKLTNKARMVGGVLAGVAITSLGQLNGFEGATSNRPNIILVMADDMGFSDLGCYGGEIKTPAIDRLASEGLRFTQFYNFASCGPSRASLMTGCYPWQVGQRPGKSIFANLTRNCVTLPQLLKAAGYLTCAVGRLDMVTSDDWHDPAHVARCLDAVLGSPSGGPGNYYRQEQGTPWFKNGNRWDRPTGPYSTDLISKFAGEFIEASADSDQPFFLYLSHYAPHWPLHADEEDIALHRGLYEEKSRAELMEARLGNQIRDGLVPVGTNLSDSMVKASNPSAIPWQERMAIHAAMISSIDLSVSQIMTALKKSDQLENTLILVFSDNGASNQIYAKRLPEGERVGGMNTFLCQGSSVASINNTPLRNYKTTYYEGGIASPLIAWWPTGLKNPARISDRLLQIADIMPTCLKLAGVTHPAEFEGREVIPLAGESFADVLSDTPEERDEDRIVAWPKALRKGDWKLVLQNPSKPELYNIATDRTEQKNLAVEFPDQVRRLKELHQRSLRP